MVLRVSLSGFIEPCLPMRAERPPSGPGWVHEIKHDGFRMVVRRDPAGVRLLTRRGNDWTERFPLIAAAAGALKARSCLLDGEAVACEQDGMPSFDRLRYRCRISVRLRPDRAGRPRPAPRAARSAQGDARLSAEQGRARPADHLEHEDGDVVFRYACKMGLEGIVSKRLGSRYRSGRSPDWIKSKNPSC